MFEVLHAELLCVLGVQSLPAAELHGLGADHASDRLDREEPIQDVEADVPARGAPRDVAAIDVVPEREARALAERLELPAHVAVAPAVLEQLRRVGPLHVGLGDLRRRRSDRRELRRAQRGEASVGVERRPFAQLRRIGQRLPDLRRRMTQVADENERPLLAFLLDLGAGRGARHDSSHGCSSLLLSSCDGGALLHPVEMAFERIDVRRPEAPERREPGIDLHERLGPDPVEAPLCFDARLHEAGLAQHAQVLGDRGLRHCSCRSISPTDCSEEASRLRIARRFGSAMIANVDSMERIYRAAYISVKAHESAARIRPISGCASMARK